MRRASCAIALALVMSCGGSPATTDALDLQVADVVVAPTASTIVVGAELPLRAAVHDASGQMIVDAPVVWTVRDTNVAVVSASGVVTARSVGTTQVAASSSGKSGLATVAVQPVPVTSVAVLPAHLDVAPRDHPTLAAVTYDAAGRVLGDRAIAWASSNTNVATIDAAGVLTAVAPGSAVVTATSEGVSGSASVSVAILAIARVEIQPRSATIQRGTTVQFSAALTDVRGTVITDRAVTWTSSRNDVATVSASGLVNGIASGAATIVAASGGRADTVPVVVVPVPVGAVSVRPTTTTLLPGQSATLTATVTDVNGAVVTGRITAWSSTDASVATVSTAGVVRAIASGTATITATSEGKSGSAAVTVAPATIATVRVSPSSASVNTGDDVTLTAVALDGKGDVIPGASFSWRSSDSYIATVSSTGRVTGQHTGTVTITATSSGKPGSATVTVKR